MQSWAIHYSLLYSSFGRHFYANLYLRLTLPSAWGLIKTLKSFPLQPFGHLFTFSLIFLMILFPFIFFFSFPIFKTKLLTKPSVHNWKLIKNSLDGGNNIVEGRSRFHWPSPQQEGRAGWRKSSCILHFNITRLFSFCLEVSSPSVIEEPPIRESFFYIAMAENFCLIIQHFLRPSSFSKELQTVLLYHYLY